MKKKIAILGSGWAFEFIDSVIHGVQKKLQSLNIDADIFFFTCYRFRNPDKSINLYGYQIFDIINFSDFDGIILLSNLFEDDDVLEKVRTKVVESGVPSVSLVRKLFGLHHIYVNNYTGFLNLINHLIDEHNTKKIAYIGGIESDVQSIERFRAFSDAMHKHSLKIDEKLIFMNGDWSFKYAYEKGLLLFADKRNLPDAIVCSNDKSALGIIQAASELKVQIPEKVKIIGFDNDPLTKCTIPSISTVDTESEKMGEKAIELIFTQTEEFQNIELKSKKVIRQSCGCCNTKLTQEQKDYTLKSLYLQDEEERFAVQLRHTEDVFINDDSVHIFWENTQNFYLGRHEFEGDNFAIMLKKELTKSLLYQDAEYTDYGFGEEMQTIVNLCNGKLVNPETIKTKSLMPANLFKGKNNIFLFLPLVYQTNIFGYYVAKNNLKLLTNKRGYPWSKNFANSIEKLREKTKYRLLSQKYLYLTTQDALSGGYNRAALDLFGNEMYEYNRHSNLLTAIFFIDINSMKIINDKNGHLHGDLAVKMVAEELRNSVPDKWLVIRYGGDEFVIIGTAQRNERFNYLKDINKKLKEHCIEMELPYKVSVSYGYDYIKPDEVDSLLQEINKVDKLMYINKTKYHNTHKVSE